MKVVIVGAGGHGVVVADILNCMQRAGTDVELIAFVDDHVPPGVRDLCGVPVLSGGLRALSAIEHDAVVVAIGDNAVRRRMSEEIRRNGGVLVIARHPSSVVAADACVGVGTVICAGAVVNPAASVGCSAILNTHSSIDHHNRIGDCAHIAPGVHLGGNVTVGDETLLGLGSIVLPGTRIGSRVVVGAGSVVLKDLPDGAVAYGVPARLRKAASPARGAALGRPPRVIRVPTA
jgi:sugar O-acyltransferase (sialic acid O-acetyltransferase NeuD family)